MPRTNRGTGAINPESIGLKKIEAIQRTKGEPDYPRSKRFGDLQSFEPLALPSSGS